MKKYINVGRTDFIGNNVGIFDKIILGKLEYV